MGFPGGSVGKESIYNAGDVGLILGPKEPLATQGLAPHFSILAPWTEEPGGLQSMGSQEPDTT